MALGINSIRGGGQSSINSSVPKAIPDSEQVNTGDSNKFSKAIQGNNGFTGSPKGFSRISGAEGIFAHTYTGVFNDPVKNDPVKSNSTQINASETQQTNDHTADQSGSLLVGNSESSDSPTFKPDQPTHDDKPLPPKPDGTFGRSNEAIAKFLSHEDSSNDHSNSGFGR